MIRVITWWLNDPFQKSDAFLSTMVIFMENNLFWMWRFIFLQFLGTAIKNLTTVMWVTVNYACYEVYTLIPKHGHNLLHFKRQIDDILGFQTGNLIDEQKSVSADDKDSIILNLDTTESKSAISVNFLDMTFSIENGKNLKPSRSQLTFTCTSRLCQSIHLEQFKAQPIA